MAEACNQVRQARIMKQRNIVIAVVTVVAVMIVALFIVLEKLIPLKPTPTPIPPSPTMNVSNVVVRSHPFPEYMLKHRQGYLRNSHVQMMGKVQERLNVSDCWLCSHLPQTADKSPMTYAQPFPLNTSCYAFFLALFDDPEKDLKTLASAEQFDKHVLGTLNCSVDNTSPLVPSRSRLLNENLDTLPYHDYVNLLTLPAPDPNVDCPRMSMHGRECPVPIHTHLVRPPELCLSRKGTIPMGDGELCPYNIEVTNLKPVILSVGRSVYFVCGDNAYLWLPADWSGSCYLALLLPDILPIHTRDLPLLQRHTQHILSKHSLTGGDFVRGLFPMYGIISNSMAIRALSALLEDSVNVTTTALAVISLEMRAIRLVTLQNRMGLDLILVKEGGLCAIVGVSCCSYIPDGGGTVANSIRKLHRIEMKAHAISEDAGPTLWSWFISVWFTWGWKILIGIFAVLTLFLFCCCCIQCMPQLCAKCASSISTTPTTRIMMTRITQYPQERSSYLVSVPGYGLLAKIQYDRPRLYVRHLYTASVYEPPAAVLKRTDRSQFPRYKYVLRPEFYAA